MSIRREWLCSDSRYHVTILNWPFCSDTQRIPELLLFFFLALRFTMHNAGHLNSSVWFIQSALLLYVRASAQTLSMWIPNLLTPTTLIFRYFVCVLFFFHSFFFFHCRTCPCANWIEPFSLSLFEIRFIIFRNSVASGSCHCSFPSSLELIQAKVISGCFF